MKYLVIVLLAVVFLSADSPKYDFTITIEIENKTISEIADIVKDLEEVAENHGAKFSIKIKGEEPEKDYPWGGLYIDPTPYKQYLDNNTSLYNTTDSTWLNKAEVISEELRKIKESAK